MTQLAFLRKAWNDNVWSKVIASGITTVLGAVLVILGRYWEALKEAGGPIYRLATAPVVVPVWLLATSGLMLMVALHCRIGWKRDVDEPYIEPNAVPIAEATVVTPSFAVTRRDIQSTDEPV